MKSAWPVLSLIAIALSLLVFITLRIIERRMDPAERTMSEHALTPPGKRLFPLATVALGFAAAFLAAGLNEHDAPAGPLVLLLVFAAGVITAGSFRIGDIDPGRRGFELTRSGVWHAVAVVAASAAICIAAPWLIQTLTSIGAHHTRATVFAWIPTIGAVALLVTATASGPIEKRAHRASVRGLGERLALAGFIIWIAYAAATALTP